MDNSKTHIYFIPGLAAGKEIFKNLSLSPDLYETHVLEWIIPEKNETLSEYSQRMATKITHPDPVLIGVSFGGVVAQEMSLLLNLKKLIIISSIKTKYEIPKKLRYAGKVKAYKLVPISTLLNASDLAKFAIGSKTKKKIALYQKYLSVKNKEYIDWSLRQLMSWKREQEVQGVIHIHGDKDTLFPIRNIKDPIVLKGGTHVMVMYKAKWLSDELPKIIENNR
jgi:hypothetical protein